MHNKTILITGASGVLAKKLISNLITRDFNIYALTRNINSDKKIQNITYCTNEDFFADKLDDIKFDVIVNCAFTQKMEAEAVFSSIDYTKKLFSKLAKMKVDSVINISTQRVYGDYREGRADENYPVNPSNVYALGKYFAEVLAELIFENTNIKYTNLRIGSLIGEEYPDRIINKMIQIAKKTNRITVQNGKQQFGYVHVNDMANAIASFICNKDIQWNQVYNIGSDEKITLLDIAEKIKNKMNKKGYKISVAIKDSDKKTLMKSELFEKLTGWKQTIKVEDFIEELLEN